MRKLLLSMAAIAAATTLQAAQKSVTFDFSNPAAYGYAAPAASAGTPLAPGDKITSGDVTVTNANGKESETAVRFYNGTTNGVEMITFRLATGGAVDIEAGGANIYSITIVGNYDEPGVNISTSDDAGWTYTWDADAKVGTAVWNGNLTKMNITRKDKTVQFRTMTVVYEGVADEPVVDEPTSGEPESFVAVSWPTTDVNGDGEINANDIMANALFTNAVIENGASTVIFGTANIDVVAVGGTTAKDVYQEAGTEFAGWTEWNDVKWDVKNQGDIEFAYIVGTGNPAVAFDAEEVLTEEQRTGHYRPTYTFYEADGSKGMPMMGLYYKFSPKVDGQLKINVWSNKGNRFTFIVDEETKQPIKYQAEGYINGQNEGTGEFNENGNEIQRKKWLSAEEIQYLHDQAKCEKDADGNPIPGTDSAPWVIGAGNQPFWGTLTLDVKGGKSYWLFQHSSQIGFQSCTFTPAEAGEQPGEQPGEEPQGDPDTFTAVSFDGETYAANDLFTNAVIENGASTVDISTTNMKAIAVGGTTAKDVYQEAGTEFAGWTEWNDVKWDVKNQGDIQFGYILGTGNPAVAFGAEEVLTEGERTGQYRPAYTFYEADGSKGMPVMGLYYKFSPKVDGQLTVNVWSNKGNRNTFIVDEDTAMPVKYVAEGYVNGQNDENGAKKWLSAEEIQYLHDQAKCEKDADGNPIPGTDSAPWVIGAGNQPFWGTLTVDVKAGKSYWMFQHSSQIGFQSYTFTPGAASSISEVVAEPVKGIFNLRGERVSSMNRGQLYIQNGQKVIIR